MANPVKIKINKVEDRSPEERKEWRRNYLTRKTARKTARNQRVRQHISNLRRMTQKVITDLDICT